MSRIKTSKVTDDISIDELRLAVRNHSMPLEALRYPITPVGLHYLLTHFDIPPADEATWKVSVGGLVRRPFVLSMTDLKAMPAVTTAVTMECAGNGRARTNPRWKSQPWLDEAVGNAEWTGTPLRGVLAEAGLDPAALEVVFTGADEGIQSELRQAYQRSLRVEDATRPEVLLAYAINGQPLPPQHGFPVRLLVPGWYGMTSVKWLVSIEAVSTPFAGYQQETAYHFRSATNDPGEPVSRMRPRSLMIPPGVPDFATRTRHVKKGVCRVEGRAWSGHGAVTKVEVSDDGGGTWSPTVLGLPDGPHAWTSWSCDWNAHPGACELWCRATDAAGNFQPVDQNWNLEGVGNNMVQKIMVVVDP